MPEISGLLDSLFVNARVRAIFDDRARLQAMLEVESALALAQAELGVIPGSAARYIEAACDAELFSLPELTAATAQAGNTAIPLIKALTAEVERRDAQAARFVHWGATSQDVIDTGLVLQLRDALGVTVLEVERCIAATIALCERYRDTPMAGRTWLQQAVPMSFGLKAAGWLDALCRDRERLLALRPRMLVLQLGGAAGTLAALGEQGLEVAERTAARLGLSLPVLPWHTQRDRIAEAGAVFGLLAGTLGKIARDISLLMQNEVAEVFEPAAAGRGGSSTMPNKRNPVGCAVALAASLRAPGLVATLLAAMTQEHERGLGGWHAEWETLPQLIGLVGGATDAMATTLSGLQVDPARMRANLDVDHGAIYAEAVSMRLAATLGKPAAHALVERASHAARERDQPLHECLWAEPEVRSCLDRAVLDALFTPEAALGLSRQLVDRAVAHARASLTAEGGSP